MAGDALAKIAAVEGMVAQFVTSAITAWLPSFHHTKPGLGLRDVSGVRCEVDLEVSAETIERMGAPFGVQPGQPASRYRGGPSHPETVYYIASFFNFNPAHHSIPTLVEIGCRGS